MNKVISILIALLGLYVMTSCSHEEGLSSNPNLDGKRTLSLKIAVPGNPNHSMTRATTEVGSNAENYIDFVYITIHSSIRGDYREVFEKEWTATGETESAVEKTFPCSVDASWLENSGNLTATVYANYKTAEIPGVITNESKFWEGGHLNILKKLFMSGDSIITKTGETYGGTVKIKRQVAKIRLKIQMADDRVPVGLTVKYDSVRVAVLNVADRADALTSHWFSQGYINFKERGGDSLRISKVDDKHVEGGVVDSCYVYENIITGSTEGTVVERTALKVTVPTYDPVADHREDLHGTFEIKGEGADSYDIKRNYIYTVIIKVRSQREPLYITSVVQPWNVRSENVGPLDPISD